MDTLEHEYWDAMHYIASINQEIAVLKKEYWKLKLESLKESLDID